MTFYDASYLSAAVSAGDELVTDDLRLNRAGRKHLKKVLRSAEVE